MNTEVTQETSAHAAAPHLTEAEVARALGVEPITVRMWRWRDRKAAEAGTPGYTPKAPPYVKLPSGRVRYPQDDFFSWLNALPRVGSVPQLPDGRRKQPAVTPEPRDVFPAAA